MILTIFNKQLQKLEIIQCFTHLGSKITYNGESKTNLKSRMDAGIRNKNIFTSNYYKSKHQKNAFKELQVAYSVV